MRWLMVLAALGYMVCAQIGAHTDLAWMSSLAVALLLMAALLPAWSRGSIPALIAGLLAALALIGSMFAGVPRLPTYFVPSLLLALAGWFFGRTLRASSRPLIGRIVQIVDGEEFAAQPAVASYARGLTQTWAILLVVLAAGAAVMALCVVPDGVLAAFGIASPLPLTPAQWSSWVNFAGYGSVALVFAGEFALRRVLLPQAPKHSFAEFARRMAHLWPELRRP
jgi:uncharacterized membrane protein